MKSYIDVFEDSGQALDHQFFRELAQMKYTPLGQQLVSYLEMKIRKDLQHLMEVPPPQAEAIAQLQARIQANGQLRALITVDETIYEEEDETNGETS